MVTHGQRYAGNAMDEASAPPIRQDRSCEDKEAELVQAAKVDPTAFDELYRRYVGSVYRYLCVHADAKEDAEDLTQQVFLKALKNLPKYEDRGLPFSAWLFRIARNAVIDARRGQRSHEIWEALPESRHPMAPQDPEAEAIRHEGLDRLRSLLDDLDPYRRDLVILHFVGGLTQREIALILGTNQTEVQRQLARALRILRERYHEG